MSDESISVAERVVVLAAQQAGVSPVEVTPAHHFVNDLNFDSLDRVEFAMELEDEFSLSIPDDAADNIHTVGEAIDYVKEHRKPGGGGSN